MEQNIVKIRIPKNALVVAIGVSGAGKSTQLRKYFSPEQIVSSDTCRRMLVGNLPSKELQAVSEGAFVMFHSWIRARLRHNLLTVADSTAIRRESREEFAKIASEEHVRTVYLFFDTPFDECIRRDAARDEGSRVGESVIKRQFSRINQSRGFLRTSDVVYTIKPNDVVDIKIVDMDMSIQAPAIDVIGDVHGCYEEMEELIRKMGYRPTGDGQGLYTHHEGRKLAFVGDLIDRGPEPFKVLDFVRRHVQAGFAFLVLSNHERKLKNYLSGRRVQMNAELQRSVDSIPADVNKNDLKRFLYGLKPYMTWTSPGGEDWVMVHAAFKPEFQGKMDGEIESYCVYGPSDGKDANTGLPNRIAWWETYRNGPNVVYGHIISDDGQPRITNGTFGIDTGAVHGKNLTAMRLPEKEFVQVPAKKVYYESISHDNPVTSTFRGYHMSFLEKPILQIKGIDGKDQDLWIKGGIEDAVNAVSTRTVRPDLLLWLAPTMSPGPLSDDPTLLEDPVTTAKWMLENSGNKLIIAQTKHMGSRGTWRCERVNGRWEITCWTKNGYEMFDEPMRTMIYDAMQAPLDRLSAQLDDSRLLVLDGEVMPWNQHGAAWLENLFMVTAGAALVSRYAISTAYQVAGKADQALHYSKRVDNVKEFIKAANNYCWPVKTAQDLKIGLFDILYPVQTMTHEQKVQVLNSVAVDFPFLRPTYYKLVDGSEQSLTDLRDYWEKKTNTDGVEGIVLKFNDPDVWTNTKFPQQQLKVRGRDFLRVIYGPQYLEPDALAALRKERRVDSKMRMATQQTLIGKEAVRRFAAGEPFERYHECVLGILAGERASIDPRL